MKTHTLVDLREALFGAIHGLNNKTLDVESAKTISALGQTIINTARVEIEHIKITGETGSSFLIDTPPQNLAGVVGLVAQGPGYTVRQHKLQG